MHVIADCAQIAIAAAIDDEGLVTAAEEMPEEFMAAIEARRVGVISCRRRDWPTGFRARDENDYS
jgi:hypothetical protein